MLKMHLKISSTVLIALLVAEIAIEVNCQQKNAAKRRTFFSPHSSSTPHLFSLISHFQFPQKPQYQYSQFQIPQKPQNQFSHKPQYQFPQTPQFQFPQTPQYQFPHIPQYQFPQYQIPQIPQFQIPQLPNLPTPSYGQVIDATLEFIRGNQQATPQKQK